MVPVGAGDGVGVGILPNEPGCGEAAGTGVGVGVTAGTVVGAGDTGDQGAGVGVTAGLCVGSLLPGADAHPDTSRITDTSNVRIQNLTV